MKKYNTINKRKIIDFLYKNSDKQFTIEEIFYIMQQTNENSEPLPGKSSMYRIITSLVDEGIVKRFVKGQGRSFVYQIGCSCNDTHLHLKCDDCGRLLHLDSDISSNVINIISKDTDFDISNENTVIFGKCADCKCNLGE